MIKAGITGGMGSGKTLVSKIFETLGIPVFDADERTKALMNEDDDLKKTIVENFGDVYDEDGVLIKKKLAQKIFTDTENLKKLNSIVHPAIIRVFDVWQKKQEAPYILKEAAILFESGTAGDLDIVIGVYAPKALRISRAMKRSGITKEETISRMDKQIDEEIKMKLCNFVIINDESRLLIPQVLTIHQKIINSEKFKLSL